MTNADRQQLTPSLQYQKDLAEEAFQVDEMQALAVTHLQALYESLLTPPSASFWSRLWSKPQVPVMGLYFWGGVGRGKTYLMDTFFETLPFSEKMRVHFHRFMRRVHKDLKLHAGHKNPLEKVAEGLALEARVICFDEFFVSDITDAMILSGLLKALFQRGVTLVATSNIAPDGLYKDGLQRARFLPAIALLKKHTRIVNVDGGVDYRLRALEQAPLYYSPLNQSADNGLLERFTDLLSPGATVENSPLVEVEGRPIQAVRVGEGVAWFDFTALCDGPRSQNDYIEIAREFHAVIVSNVPAFHGEIEDQARRFINLVDEFYDRQVKLVLSAESVLEGLYQNGRLAFEFERTVSRLQEMQSHEYLALPHRP